MSISLWTKGKNAQQRIPTSVTHQGYARVLVFLEDAVSIARRTINLLVHKASKSQFDS